MENITHVMIDNQNLYKTVHDKNDKILLEMF